MFTLSVFTTECVRNEDTTIFGLNAACQRAIEISRCDNVATVDVINCETGEIMLSIQYQRITWIDGLGEFDLKFW